MELSLKQCVMLFCMVLQLIASVIATEIKYGDGKSESQNGDDSLSPTGRDINKRQVDPQIIKLLRDGGLRVSLRSGARSGFDRISHSSGFSALGKRADDKIADIEDLIEDPQAKRGFDRISYQSNLGFGKRNGDSEYNRYKLASYLVRALQQSENTPFNRYARAFGYPRMLRNPHKGFDRIGHSSSFSRLG